jgi:hypothetical protein
MREKSDASHDRRSGRRHRSGNWGLAAAKTVARYFDKVSVLARRAAGWTEISAPERRKCGTRMRFSPEA